MRPEWTMLIRNRNDRVNHPYSNSRSGSPTHAVNSINELHISRIMNSLNKSSLFSECRSDGSTRPWYIKLNIFITNIIRMCVI